MWKSNTNPISMPSLSWLFFSCSTCFRVRLAASLFAPLRSPLIWNRYKGNFRFLVPLLVWVMLSSAPAWGGEKRYTWYLDGAVVEQEVETSKGIAEVMLPSGLLTGSLRIRPLGNARLARVELVSVKPGAVEQKEEARLVKRREELLDRLKALEVKEEIFKATAKSQGGKAPRRTRTNPEPLTAIRQGTDFAIARLEEVYRARRTAERELTELESRQPLMRRQGNLSGSLAKIRLEDRRGAVMVSYAVTGNGWRPRYDVRVSGDTAEVSLFAMVPGYVRGGTTVVASRLSDPPGSPFLALKENKTRLAAWKLPATVDIRGPRGIGGVVVRLRNEPGHSFAPGEASLFLKEEYIGTAEISGRSDGGIIELAIAGSTLPGEPQLPARQ